MEKWGFMNWLKKYPEDKKFSMEHLWPDVEENVSHNNVGEIYNMNDYEYLSTLDVSTTADESYFENLRADFIRSIKTRGWLPRLVYSHLFRNFFSHQLLAPSDMLANSLKNMAAFSSVSPTSLLQNQYNFDISQFTNVKHVARIMVDRQISILCHHENGLVLGNDKVLQNKKVLWCCKISESEFVAAYTPGVSRCVRKSSNNDISSSMMKMTLFKNNQSTDLEMSNKLRKEISNKLQKKKDISAFSDTSSIIFVTNIYPLRTVTYLRKDKNTDGSIKHKSIVEESTSFQLFHNLSGFLKNKSIEILPQSSAMNENGKFILCGKMIFHDKNHCAPNAFIENFGLRKIGTYAETVTTTLQFFYRLEKRNDYRMEITGVSSAFHPSLPDESINIFDTFAKRYSVEQTVVGLDVWKGTTLLFWKGTSNTTNEDGYVTHMQVFDNKLIYSIISSKRTSISNFALHANYLRALKPKLVKYNRLLSQVKHFDMVGARRTVEESKAFNPTIQHISKTNLLVLMRQTGDVVDWDKPNQLVVETGSFIPRAKPKYRAIETNIVQSDDNCGIMDARLIYVSGAANGNFYVIYYTNLNVDEVKLENENRKTRKLPTLEKKDVRSRMFIQQGNWQTNRNILHINEGEIATPFCHYRSRSEIEKNWSVFVTGEGDINFQDTEGRVKFIMSIDPLIVYGASRIATTKLEDCPREKSVNLPLEFSYMLQQNKLDLRGGSCGIPYGNEKGDFLFVGHGLQKSSNDQKNIDPCFPDYFVGEWHSCKERQNASDENKYRAGYDQMYWVFFYVIGKDNEDRWKVKQMSMCSQLHGRSNPYPKIAFASGLTKVENGYNVAFGEWDQSSVFTFLSDDFMEAVLRPTEELDNQSYITDCALFESLLLDYCQEEEENEEEEDEEDEEEEEEEEKEEEQSRKHKGKGKGKRSREEPSLNSFWES